MRTLPIGDDRVTTADGTGIAGGVGGVSQAHYAAVLGRV